MQVNIDPFVYQKLGDLIQVLLDKDYFATHAKALAYVDSIYKFIISIPRRTARNTKNNRYGNFYATYKANRRTTWYIMYDIEDDVYLIRNVINNHTEDYPRFIAGL